MEDNKKSGSVKGHAIAAGVALILFTGVVMQLAPIASVRSERYIGPSVVQAQEDLSGIEAQCAEEPTPTCDAEIATAESELAAAQKRLETGKKVDRLMATIVPFGEMITAFGPIILIEVFAMVILPFLRLRGAQKKRDRLALALSIRQQKVRSERYIGHEYTVAKANVIETRERDGAVATKTEPDFDISDKATESIEAAFVKELTEGR